jgi:hypothetical protein
MGALVALYAGKEGRVKTWDLWQGFGYKEHRTLKRIISENLSEFESRGLVISASTDAETKKGKGRPDESYFLNERQFILLVMLAKNTPESVQLKSRVEVEFHKMRLQLAKMAVKAPDWQQVRQDGKAVYHQKTDIIKSFAEYATEQGSQSAKMYYKNLATMENKALFLFEQKFKNTREMLNIRQLMQVSTADQIIEKALQDGMDKNLDYHDIYQLAKERVIQFSAIIGKSQVMALLEQDKQVSLEDLK